MFFTRARNDRQPSAAPPRRFLAGGWTDVRLVTLVMLLIAALVALGLTVGEALQVLVAGGLLTAHLSDARLREAATAAAAVR